MSEDAAVKKIKRKAKMQMVDKEQGLMVEFKEEDTEGKREEAMVLDEGEEINAKAEETKTEEKMRLLLNLIEQVGFSLIVILFL